MDNQFFGTAVSSCDDDESFDWLADPDEKKSPVKAVVAPPAPKKTSKPINCEILAETTEQMEERIMAEQLNSELSLMDDLVDSKDRGSDKGGLSQQLRNKPYKDVVADLVGYIQNGKDNPIYTTFLETLVISLCRTIKRKDVIAKIVENIKVTEGKPLPASLPVSGKKKKAKPKLNRRVDNFSPQEDSPADDDVDFM